MRMRDKASPARNQQGMASIVVVSVLIIIMTLISIGFARLVNRSVTNSANRQFSASATYAAQSAINDVAGYLKQYAAANPGSSFLPKSTKCNGAGSLIGSSASPGPFYNASNLSGDNSTKYTCLLLDPTPTSLVYTQVASLKSQVVKVNTSAASGALDKLMISWQPSDTTITGYPVSASSLDDQTTWNSSTGICKNGGFNASCIPLLRVSIFPVANSSVLSGLQAKSKTIFLYPQSPSGNVPVRAFTDNTNLPDGALIPVACSQTVGATDFNPSTNSDYKCNIIISALAGSIAPDPTDSVYLRLTPIYNQADIKIAANDKFGDSLNFISDQAIIDATAQTANVAKRLQARVDTSSLAVGAGSISDNISSSSNLIPEQSVRVANALCKRDLVTTPSLAGFPAFVNFDDPDNVCHDLGGTNSFTNPVPTLTFNITGNDGTDIGRAVDSEANNPDSPQNPVQIGTVYVNSGATLRWTTTDATSCTAAGGWSGEKLASASGVNASGSQSIGGITNVTEYDLTCSRPFAPSTTPTKKVFAWPPPTVTISGPSSVNAGDPYTLSWSSTNAKPNGCALSGGNWKDPSDTKNADSETMTWPANDNSASKTFRVTCIDPIGRSAVKDWLVGASVGPPTGTTVNAPSCSADWSLNDNGNGTGTLTFNGACPGGGYFRFTDCSADFVSAVLTPNSKNCGDGVGGSSTLTVGVGHYCANYWAGLDPWGWRANSSIKCFDVAIPPVVVNASTVGAYHFTTGPGSGTCHDTVHAYILCVSWNASQNDNKVHNPPGAPYDGGVIGSCSVQVISTTFGASGYSPKAQTGLQAGNPAIYQWWNVTLGWDSDPGSVSVNMSCTSQTYGNEGHTTLPNAVSSGGFVDTPPVSGGGGGGGGGSGGGGLHQSSTCYDDSGNFAHAGGCTSSELKFAYTTGVGCYDSSNNFVSKTGC